MNTTIMSTSGSATVTRRALSRRSLFGGALAMGTTAVGLAMTSGSAAAASPKPRGTGPEVATDLMFNLLPSPVRVYDSRAGAAPDGTDGDTGAGDTALSGGLRRTIDMVNILGSAANPSGVPPFAAGVLCNLTITGTVGAGWLRVWAHGATEPTSSSINWSASGQTVANMMVSAVSLGYLDVRCGPAASSLSTHFLLDVIGYYAGTSIVM